MPGLRLLEAIKKDIDVNPLKTHFQIILGMLPHLQHCSNGVRE